MVLEKNLVVEPYVDADDTSYKIHLLYIYTLHLMCACQMVFAILFYMGASLNGVFSYYDGNLYIMSLW